MILTEQTARDLVDNCLLRIVPDADLDALADDALFLDDLELEWPDFLSFVELLQPRIRPADRRGRLPAAAHHSRLRDLPQHMTAHLPVSRVGARASW